MGFVLPPHEFHLGLPRWQHWTLQVDELDVVLYSLEKAVRLLLKSNPNIVGLLWLRESEYVHQHPAFGELRARRDILSSQAAAEAFAGCAADQLKRMEAFDLDRMAEYEALTSAIGRQGPLREVLEADAQKLRHIAANWGFNHDLLTRFRKLHREHFSGYMGEKRKAMVRKYQYDVKNAAHLIRLLRMGSEFIVSGILAQLMAASPTFAKNWDLTATHYPPSDPETLPAALYALSSHLQQLVVKDRHAELAPLLTALEVAYAHASPARREHLRQCVIGRLAWDCREMGLDPQLFLTHLGPRCRAVWAEAESDRV